MSKLSPESLTWTALLAKWIEFAKGSVALPDDADGDRWRRAVPAVINLQAVTFALADLARVAPADRPLARDRADVLIAEQGRSLETIWRGVPMPETLLEMIGDARSAAEVATYAGAIEWVWPGPEPLVVPALDVPDRDGTSAVMQPGTIVMPGTPILWWTERKTPPVTGDLPACTATTPDLPHQVYRQLDDDGRIVRDVVLPITAEPVPGMPLLVPLAREGRPIGHFTMDADTWEARQRAAMAADGIEVVHASRSA